jgi:predicted RNase H-like HicB family nuclease
MSDWHNGESRYDAIACWIEAALENGRAVPKPSAHLLSA